jgi:hypothetical protein
MYFKCNREIFSNCKILKSSSYAMICFNQCTCRAQCSTLAKPDDHLDLPMREVGYCTVAAPQIVSSN